MENSRRLFFKKSILGLGIIALPSILQAKKNTQKADLTAFCYVLFPHEGLSILHYEKCAEDLLSNNNKKVLLDGIYKLNKIHGIPFSDLKYIDQKRTVQYIKSVDNDFFTLVRSYLITALYGNDKIWPYFGYEGPSFAKGGYLDRGFNDINWL